MNSLDVRCGIEGCLGLSSGQLVLLSERISCVITAFVGMRDSWSV